jgi:hypothetical protein
MDHADPHEDDDEEHAVRVWDRPADDVAERDEASAGGTSASVAGRGHRPQGANQATTPMASATAEMISRCHRSAPAGCGNGSERIEAALEPR